MNEGLRNHTAESSVAKALRKLVVMLQGSGRNQLGLMQYCQRYFHQQPQRLAELAAQQQKLQASQAALQQATRKTEAALIADAQQVRQQFQQLEAALEQERLQNHELFVMLCRQLLALTEGQSRADTIQRSSRLLGTLQLLTPQDGNISFVIQQKYKPFYKAVLALRLLDQLLDVGLLRDDYVLQKQQQRLPYGDEQAELCPFRNDVQVPLLMAVLLQELGQQQPQAQQMLQQVPGQSDAWRKFSPFERDQFIQCSQQGALDFLQHGMAMARYRGNSRTEREQFLHNEQQKLQWIVRLLKEAPEPEQGSGNLLRIPQVYASAVLPGRARFTYEAMPKVALILKNGARLGHYDERMVDQLLIMTGIFPQGFGIVFMPKDPPNGDGLKYEFAIVNSLYPPSPEVPLCRVVTRDLRYRSVGYNCSVSVDYNLYFKPARQRLRVIPTERLQDILQKLNAGFEPGQLRHLLPRSWHPAEFFTDPKQHNLWNRLEVVSN